MRATLLAACALLLAVAGCENPNRHCGPNQVFEPAAERCACSPGFHVDFIHGTCVACGVNEVADGQVCVCAPGFERWGPGGKCITAPLGLDVVCGPGLPCTVEPFTTCRMYGDRGACTTAGCKTSADCPTGFACDLTTSPSTCKRPPTGQGSSCLQPTDCLGQEATYCEETSYHQCLVPDCDLVSGAGCFDGWKCCDMRPANVQRSVCFPEAVACPHY